MLRLTKGLAFALATFLMAGTAQADPIIQQGPGGGNPDENIIFNSVAGLGGTTGPNTTIQGATNQSGMLLDITSGGPQIEATANGQARVEAAGAFGADGVTFMNNDFDFITDFKFNVNASHDGQLQIDVYGDEAGTNLLTTGTFDLDGNGQNFFRILDGTFARVDITTLGGNAIDDLRQIRISGGAIGGGGTQPGPFTGVPEPAGLMLWAVLAIVVFGGLYLRSRRVVVA